MISTMLATLAMGQNAKPSFKMILVAGNEHPLGVPSTLIDPSTDGVTVAVQKLVKDLDKSESSWVVIDGANIGSQSARNDQPVLATISGHFDYVFGASNRNSNRTLKEMSRSKIVDGHTVRVPSIKEQGLFFVNLTSGAGENNLMLTNLSALPFIEQEKQPDFLGYMKNSIAVSRDSVSETDHWLRDFKGEVRPTMVLCASGRPQDGHRDLLAFPPEKVILTYQVSFDKRWSAELKDIIRVQ